jgi:hypothetical protein
MAAATTVPRTNLPTGFNFSGRHRVNPSSTGYQAGKTKSQVKFIPKRQRPLTNGGDKSNHGLYVAGFDTYWGDPSSNNWYPSARPLKQYRLRGTSSSLGTYVSTDDVPSSSSYIVDGENQCNFCPKSNLSIGVPFKMIGKNEKGINKDLPTDATASYDDAGCRVCDPTRGPVLNQLNVGPTHGRGSVMSFSGGARLRSGVTTVSKNYYQTHSSYMRSRGKDYVSNAIVHKVPGIEYNQKTNGGSEIVWPVTMQKVELAESPFLGQTLDSSFYRGNACVPSIDQRGDGYSKLHAAENCSLSIYKPNNSQFAQQGAVDSSSRITRLKYNTITKNNASFFNNGDPTQWGLSSRSNIVPNLMYQSNPVFFIKNKASNGNAFHHNGNKTVCGGYQYSPCNGPSKMAFTLPLAIGGR